VTAFVASFFALQGEKRSYKKTKNPRINYNECAKWETIDIRHLG